MSKTTLRSTIMLKNGSTVRIEDRPDWNSAPGWIKVECGEGITQYFPLQSIESIEIVEQKAQSA